VRNKFARGVLAILKSSVIVVLCRPDLIVVTAVTELGITNARGIMDSSAARAK